MSTTIRSKISKKNKYWIHEERYLELKHFCMQYSRWKDAYLELSQYYIPERKNEEIKGNDVSDSTANIAILLEDYSRKLQLVEQCAIESDPDLYDYILKAVTKNIPFVALKAMYDIPCGRDMFYDRYRKFFYILDKRRK